jgi:hypothetical protein
LEEEMGEKGESYAWYQYPFPFIEGKRELFLAWEAFFHTTNLDGCMGCVRDRRYWGRILFCT